MMDNLINSLERINKILGDKQSLNTIEIDLLKKYTLEFYEQLYNKNSTENIENTIVEPSVENELPKVEISQENTFKTEFLEPKSEESATLIIEREMPVEPILEEKKEIVPEPKIETPTEIESEIIAPKVEIVTENTPEKSVEAERTVAIEEEIKKVEIQNTTSISGAKNVFNKVEDLRKAISIQKKFEYIKSLFANDLEEYTKTIHQLNNMSNIDVALSYYNDIKIKQNWQDDDKLVMELLDLVNRRYS